MSFVMDFNFPYSHLQVKGLDLAAVNEYSRKMEYEVPFEAWSFETNSFTSQKETKKYVINPNLVTYVEITENKE